MSTLLSAQPGRRLLAVIFIIAATLLAVSMWVTFRVGRVSIEAQQEMVTQLSVLNHLPELASTVKDAETGQRGYLLTGEDAYLQPYTDSLLKIKMKLASLQKLVEAGEVSSNEFAQTSTLIDRKLVELDLTIQLRREKGLAAALDEVRTDRGRNLMDQIRAIIEQMRKQALSNYDQAVGRRERTDVWRTVTFVGVTVINLAFLAWAFRRIAYQEWLQTGQRLLSIQLSGEQQIKELGLNALKFLAEYLNANVGALFIEEGNTFRIASTYAVPAPQNLPSQFSAGEGLLGQAASDKRAFQLQDVPEHYLSIGSGLGQMRARRLLIAPMKVDDRVNAVIELGYYRSSRGNELKFLELVSEIIGTAVRSAKYRTRLQELLQETQRQAQELQTQSEELRVSNEELAEQSRALKESQARLEQQQAELEQSNSQLEEQAQILESQKDDLTRSKRELEVQAAVVEEASRYKSDFLANMSHELRTPLNSALILAKLLSDNREGNLSQEQVKYAQTIQAAGNDLLVLINDVLDLAKVESGHMDLHSEEFKIEEVLAGLRSAFEPLAAAKNLSLHFSASPDAPIAIKTDRRRLEQVLKNLLSNAIKFTEKGEIRLEVRNAANEFITFAVRDTGIGIPQDKQKLVFEPFCQADSATNRKYAGTGLGLSISRELVRLMGGSITIQSAVGTGSVFTITIPKVYRSSNVLADTSGQKHESVHGESMPLLQKSVPGNGDEAFTVPSKKSNIPDDREQMIGQSRAILIVEDDESFARILLELAHELNFLGVVAFTAEESLALARRYQPSAVILDVGLPDNSGMFVLERLKADSRTRHIPVHIVSASDYSETALAKGAVGYMLKPVQREQLVEAFHKLEMQMTQKMRRLLLVEDDPVQLESLGRLLGSRDVEMVSVRTAADCLAKLKHSTFDCMVLDLGLPDATGFSLLETLSAEESYSFPPVIIYTGRELGSDEEQRLRKYSKSIIIKGVKSPERLLDEVTLFLHQVVTELPPEKQRMLEKARSRDATLDGRRILVAEDDVRNIFALTCLLEPKGLKIEIARNGHEALQSLDKASKKKSSAIDLVLMDIMMPEMNGLEAIREIRKNPEWRRLPVIAMTAKAMKSDQEQCIRAGASDYLAKPLDVEKLLSLIRVWMPR